MPQRRQGHKRPAPSDRRVYLYACQCGHTLTITPGQVLDCCTTDTEETADGD